jgi:hypothetical protein
VIWTDKYRVAFIVRIQLQEEYCIEARQQAIGVKSFERRLAMLLLIIILVLLFGGGGGYYGYSRWGAGGGIGILGTVLLIVLAVYLLGGVR